MLDKTDYKWVMDKPDPNFSPKRNQEVIDKSIKKYDEMREAKMKLFREGVGERSEAVVSFLKHVNDGKNNIINNYFTPKMLAHLRGEEIIDSIKEQNKLLIKPKPFYTQGGIVKSSTGGIVGREVSNVKKKLQRQKELGEAV
jgi:hypothetical protein